MEEWIETICLYADTFMADVDAALVEQTFNIAERKRKSDIHYHRKLDNLGRCLEVANWVFGHS